MPNNLMQDTQDALQASFREHQTSVRKQMLKGQQLVLCCFNHSPKQLSSR
jgi:hypothetical protein